MEDPMFVPLARQTHWKVVLPPLLAPVLAVLLVWAAAQPWTVTHVGYGISGPLDLPARVNVAGRHYTRSSPAGSCQRETELRATYGQSPHQVGVLISFVGLPHRLMDIGTPAGRTGTVLFVMHGGDCYISYALSGGP